jgi:bifunctional oligoribonuclease and PAP phosphatase NrnA
MIQHYPQSLLILDEIKKSQKIFINIHRNPDLDSVGSATALFQALKMIGKKAVLICPNEIPRNLSFLEGVETVQTVDFNIWAGKPRPYELFLILDSGSADIVTGSKEINLPSIKKIIIDHHLTNNWKEYVHRLLDTKASATAEIIYHMLTDWGIEIDENISTSLLSGIAGDTVFFKYPKDPKTTFNLINELIKKGADYGLLVKEFSDSTDYSFIKLLGEFLKNMQRDRILNDEFIWSAVDYQIFDKYGKQKGVREMAADAFFRSVKGCQFGIAILEEEKGRYSMSFRSKGDCDVSKLAEKFGGGGHKNAAGATFKGKIDEIITKIKNR